MEVIVGGQSATADIDDVFTGDIRDDFLQVFVTVSPLLCLLLKRKTDLSMMEGWSYCDQCSGICVSVDCLDNSDTSLFGGNIVYLNQPIDDEMNNPMVRYDIIVV
jgi:hypothetical protein